jgi:hypothetical protein
MIWSVPQIGRYDSMGRYPYMRREDLIQKTWVPEGTVEYKHFKQVTRENTVLAKFLKDRLPLAESELVLDVGGREGDISTAIQKSEWVHIVDPDPTISVPANVGRFFRGKIQDLALDQNSYSLIICSHVLGYLGKQSVQDKVFSELLRLLNDQGKLVLFYNINDEYMGELLKFSKTHLQNGHFDYFDEALFSADSAFDVILKDVKFDLRYDSYEDLGRCCWFLFGSLDQDIDKVAAEFVPKLKRDLGIPEFEINERIAIVARKDVIRGLMM